MAPGKDGKAAREGQEGDKEALQMRSKLLKVGTGDCQY